MKPLGALQSSLSIGALQKSLSIGALQSPFSTVTSQSSSKASRSSAESHLYMVFVGSPISVGKKDWNVYMYEAPRGFVKSLLYNCFAKPLLYRHFMKPLEALQSTFFIGALWSPTKAPSLQELCEAPRCFANSHLYRGFVMYSCVCRKKD